LCKKYINEGVAFSTCAEHCYCLNCIEAYC
jgi:hypothetical protein